MSLLSGSLSYRRLRILDRVDVDDTAFNRLIFREELSRRSDEANAGWVSVDGTELVQHSGDATVIGVRIDSKRVNGKLLAIKVGERIAAVKAEKGLERIGAAYKREIRDAVKEELTSRALPGVTTVDLMWFADIGQALLFSTSDAALDIVGALFRETTRLQFYPYRLADWLADGGLTWDEIESQCAAVTGETQPSLPLPEPERYLEDPLALLPTFASDFLLWVWWQTEHNFGSFKISDVPTDLWIDDKLTFKAMEEKPIINSFSGGAPSTTPEAKLSILSGKGISEARIGMRQGDAEYAFTLRVREGDLEVRGLKLPTVVKDGTEEMLIERAALIGVVHSVIGQLLVEYLSVRSDGWAKTDAAMQRWLLGDES
jgi:hypothetical protein